MQTLLYDISLILISSTFLSLGFIAFRQPPLLGYIMAGILLGPAVTQVVQDTSMIHIVGDFGMILLLFLVGLELSLIDFKKMWKSALLCLIIQIILGLLIANLCALFFDWPIMFRWFIVFNLSLSSTAVVVTLLENLDMLHGKIGSFSISLLIAQDLSLVPMLLILRRANSDASVLFIIAQLVLAIATLVGCVLYFGRQYTDLKKRLEYKTLLKKPEVTTLIGAAICFAFASVSEFLQLSPPYGAFLAGLILGNRWDRHMLMQAFVPITSMMMMVFFLSVGMRVSLDFIWINLYPLLFVLGIITLFKFVGYILGLVFMRWSFRSTIFAAALLSQLSEFSFLLIDEALRMEIIGLYAVQFFVALTTLSLSFGAIIPLIVRHYQDRKERKKHHYKVNRAYME